MKTRHMCHAAERRMSEMGTMNIHGRATVLTTVNA